MAYTTIDDPSAYFQTALYTGNESTNVITNDGNSDLQPDWWWGADRTGTNWNSIYDSSRGVTKQLNTNVTNSEYTVSNGMASFNSDGFTLGSHDNSNKNSHNHVAWQWKANGGTTSTNNDGDVTTTVQANTTAGFSIITYDGNNGGGSTVGHGLGAVPEWIITKSRVATKPWQCYHKSIGNDHFIDLDSTNAKVSASASWGNTTPTSSIVTLGNGDTNHTGAMVMYCFTSKQGYSKFGSYTGNGNADGTFVYTGFSPAWVMIKVTSGTKGWHIHDTKRPSYNPATNKLSANASDAESTNSVFTLDLLSNGFKLRSSDNEQNGNGDTYIYMAFAESPFVSSEGVPTTAR